MKLLLFLGAVALLVWLLRRDLSGLRKAARQKPASPPPQRPGTPAALATPEAMVRCATCGLHLPAGDALPAPDGSRYYCCAEHRLPPA